MRVKIAMLTRLYYRISGGNLFVNRQTLVAGVIVAALAGTVAACGSDDPESKPTPKATPKVTASATPTVVAQPQGADGVTVEIQNWTDYAGNPVVLSWKQTTEAVQASVNQGQVLPAMRRGMTKNVLRQYLPSLKGSWKQGLVVRPVAKIKVERVRTSGDSSTLVTCFWGPSTSLYTKAGEVVGEPEKFWLKQTAKLKARGDSWVITKFEFDGKCKGGAPT